MKIEKIIIPAAGTWARDCELISLTLSKGFYLTYHKDADNTYWKLKCEEIVAYKVINEELSTTGYLSNMPLDWGFFEIIDSPWIKEFGTPEDRILNNCKHYILKFYDEVIEIIARIFIFEKLPEKPTIPF